MNSVYISPLNPIRFVQQDVITPDKYSTPQFDDEWFSNLIYSWQKKATYAQKMQFGDDLNLQIWTSSDAAAALKVYNCKGELVATKAFVLNPLIPPLDLNGTFVYTYVQEYKAYDFFEGLSEPEGIYCFAIEVTFDDTTTIKFISEPVWAKATHEETILVEYRNTYNKDSIVFEQTNLVLGLRVEGSVLEFTPTANRVVFEDQGYDTVQLSATATRQWKAYFGSGQKQIPDYMVDKLNHIFACDSIKIEGHGYSQTDKSTLDIERDITYPLSMASILLGERNNVANYQFSSGDLVVMDNIPGGDFVLFGLTIGLDGFPAFNLDAPKFVQIAVIASTITQLNTMASNQGLIGSFVHVNNTLVYRLGAGEEYDESSVKILDKRMMIYVAPQTGTTSSVKIGILGQFTTQNSPFAYVGSNGFTDQLLWFGVSVTNYDQYNTLTVNTPAGQSHPTYLYHDGTLQSLSIESANCNNIAGEYPDNLAMINVYNSGLFTGFTFPVNTYKTLQQVNVIGCSNLISSGTLDGIGVGQQWEKLWFIRFSGCKISSANVDAFFNSTVSVLPLPPGQTGYLKVKFGTIDLSGQTPSAPPTSASADARAALTNGTNYSWNLQTD